MIFFYRIISILTLSALLTGCNLEDFIDQTNSQAPAPSSRMAISGSVGDGPIIGASVTIRSSNGTTLVTTTSDPEANYSTSIEITPEDFPLIVEAVGGTDLVTRKTPDFILVSVISNSSQNNANLNPHSTIIVHTAQAMTGGLTEENLEIARQAVIEKLNFGLDTDMINNPITVNVDYNNVTVLTHSSEALAEMLRRSSLAIGETVNEDRLIHSLALDLSDGALDGLGQTGTNPQHTAVAHVVSLQVLIEAMLHDLHVNGTPADNDLAAAINTILEIGSKPPTNDSSTNINKLMLDQAKAALAATQVIYSSGSLVDLSRVLGTLEVNATSAEMTSALEQYSLGLTSISSALNNNIGETVTATREEIAAINDAANTPEFKENTHPRISGNPASSLPEGAFYSFTPSASDADGDSLVFTVSNQPAWSQFDGSNGTLSGTPGFEDAGVYENIQISVSDGTTSTSMDPFTIIVGGTNRPPSISGVSATTVAEGVVYSFTPDASDTDGDDLSFTIANQPAWSNFDSYSGTLSGTPGFQDAGSYDNIVIGVTDGKAVTSISPFSLNVINTNRMPYISGSPANTAIEGEVYIFVPEVADPDGDRLTFSVVNLPDWASFNTATGTLEGTPGPGNIGDYVSIGISVSDSTASSSLSEFSISVNQAPTTTYTLAEITSYAIDIGDSEFNLSPAAFLSTGATIGHTTNLAQNNTYHFKINVLGPSGSILSDFSTQVVGYHVYLGTASDSLSHAFDLTDGLDGNYWISDLMTGTYYLSISAYDSRGDESQLSNIAEIQVF